MSSFEIIQNFEQQNAQRIHVSLQSIVGGIFLFWCYVKRCSNVFFLRVLIFGEVIFGDCGKSEISYFYFSGRKKYICRLDVSMNQVFRMQVWNSLKNLRKNKVAEFSFSFLFRIQHIRIQRHSRAKFHLNIKVDFFSHFSFRVIWTLTKILFWISKTDFKFVISAFQISESGSYFTRFGLQI